MDCYEVEDGVYHCPGPDADGEKYYYYDEEVEATSIDFSELISGMSCYYNEDGAYHCYNTNDGYYADSEAIQEGTMSDVGDSAASVQKTSSISCYEVGDGYYHCPDTDESDFNGYESDFNGNKEPVADFADLVAGMDCYYDGDGFYNCHPSNEDYLPSSSNIDTTEETALVQKNSSVSGSRAKMITFAVSVAILPVALIVLCCAVRRRIRNNRYSLSPKQLAVFETKSRSAEGYECRVMRG